MNLKKKRHSSTKANREIFGHKIANGDQKFENSD